MADYRGRLRRRYAALMALIVSPVILLVAVVKVIEPHDYPAGDVRNEPIFWLVLGAAFMVLVAAFVIGSIRELRRGQP